MLDNAMIIALFGPPGSGKGTIGGLLEKKLNIPRLSTGEAFRAEIARRSEDGQKFNSYISKGHLVPDEMTMDFIAGRIKEYNGHVLLDGIPRTLAQASLLENEGIHVDVVLSLMAPDEMLVKRLSTRIQCPKGHVYNITMNPPKKEGICDVCKTELYRREDDAPDKVQERLVVYRSQTAPLLNHYKNILVSVDATKAASTVCEEALKKLDSYNKRK